MNRFRLTNRARRDIDEIWLYLGRKQSPDRADAVTDAILDACLRLADTPGMGTALPGMPGWRSYSVNGYLILFRPIPRGIEIERVVHGARDIESFLRGPPY